MKITKFAVIGATAGVLGGLLVGAPALAADTMTSLSFSPTTLRSGDTLTTTVNGSSADVNYGFAGCYGEFLYGYSDYSNISNPNSFYTGGTSVEENLNAYDLVYIGEGWDGADCSGGTRPGGTPDWSGTYTTTPQLVIDPVTLTVGKSPSAPGTFTDKSSTGVSPFDWSLGGQFAAETDSECSLSPTANDPNLPDGVTIDDTFSQNGSEPVLSFVGTPTEASIGTYKTCVSMSDGNGTTAYAWVDVTVKAAALPDTGINQSALGFAAGAAALIALLGVGFVVRRRAS